MAKSPVGPSLLPKGQTILTLNDTKTLPVLAQKIIYNIEQNYKKTCNINEVHTQAACLKHIM